jgi:hypothetical protein
VKVSNSKKCQCLMSMDMKRGCVCKQNNQLSTKSGVELEDNSIDPFLFGIFFLFSFLRGVYYTKSTPNTIRVLLFELRSLVEARGISHIHYKLLCNITLAGTKMCM